MRNTKLALLSWFLYCICNAIFAQPVQETNNLSDIQSIQFTLGGNGLSYPILSLGETEKLQLEFDDLSATTQSYYYTFLLCDANWQPSLLPATDYLKGFNQVRINNYQPSSISKTKYYHYSIKLPENDCMPIRSGNYLLKVFLNGDTSQLAFTRKLLITENITPIQASVSMPFDMRTTATHQKVAFNIATNALNITDPYRQVKASVLQNYRWDNAVVAIPPTFVRNNELVFSDERSLIFESGNEYRWLDMSDFRMRSDKIANITFENTQASIELIAEYPRVNKPYTRYQDFNGAWTTRTTNALKRKVHTQGDYADVQFYFIPEKGLENQPSVYVLSRNAFGSYTSLLPMKFNTVEKKYEAKTLLKEGFYTYCFVTKDNPNAMAKFEFTEGNFKETENEYTILIYYRGNSDLYDRLVGVRTIQSVQ